jgi:hypothetical protein
MMTRTHILNISAMPATSSSIKLSHMEETTSIGPVLTMTGADTLRAAAGYVSITVCCRKEGDPRKEYVPVVHHQSAQGTVLSM